MRLVLVVSDCPPVLAEGEPPDAPPLPAIAALLRASRVAPMTGGWRAELTRRFAPPPARALAPGVIASAALAGPPGGHACLATPVHLLATPDHLRLPADGLLRLSDDEGAALAADFARVFDGAGLALQPLRGRFVLSGLAGEGGEDPAQVLGSKLAATTRGAPAWRRLASEIELWLHSHPLNARRESRRQPRVDALWLWGGGPVPEAWPQVSATRVDLHGDDGFLAGLAALAGTPLRSTDADVGAGNAGAADVVLQHAVVATPREGGRTLAELDATVVASQVERLRRGELESIELLIGTVAARATRGGFARFWRRRRPWWEYLRR